MRLFHGSNMEIGIVDLSKCMPNKDFGCGFYTTLLEEQAWRMAQRRTRIAGGVFYFDSSAGEPLISSI